MMYALANGNTYEYRGGFDEVVYLVSSVYRILDLGCDWIASDRNAALSLAQFTDDYRRLPHHIRWDVIRAKYWGDFEDGADLRAAEFLVRDSVPWGAVDVIGVKTRGARSKVESVLASAPHQPQVQVHPEWYF